MIQKPRSFDLLGNIAIVKFPDDFKQKDKKKFGQELMSQNNSIKTILEKTSKVKGRLRKNELTHIIGEKTEEVLYKENGCVFRFNAGTSYFSPRLSNERKEIANCIKPKESVLVMFAGVAPYSIVIAKKSKAKKVVSNEINREANKYAKLNIELNKLKDDVELIQGDIKRLVRQEKLNEKFDVIVMPRPQLKDSFLDEAFKLSKKGTRIFYYGFCKVSEVKEMYEMVKQKARENNKKINITGFKKAGEIAPYKIRFRIDLKIIG